MSLKHALQLSFVAKLLFLILVCLLGMGVSQSVLSAENERVEFLIKSLLGTEVDLIQQDEQYGYAMGFYMAEHVESQLGNLEGSSIKVDKSLIIKGFVDRLVQQGRISSEQAESIVLELSKKIQQAKKTVEEKASEKNKVESDAFTQSVRKNQDYVTTSSGLLYRVLSEGGGRRPTLNETAVVHYRGTLINGETFDSSYERGEPARFKPTQVIEGWKEALLMMRKGSRWEVIIPPELGYGTRSTGKIPANSVLIFEIELLDIE